MKNTEIEKKYLIKYPEKRIIENIREEDRSEIIQTYLLSPEGITARVRKRSYTDGVKYYKTEKMRLSDMSAIEDEREIGEAEYLEELKKADPERRPIEKQRLLLPSGNHVFEIDLYPFWCDRAIMEVELKSEDEEFTLPPDIEIIRDVTGDRRYKNAALAREIPND